MEVLPDIMIEKSNQHQPLDWVGMTQIQSAMKIGEFTTPVQLDVGVNLREENRGIHMSRLYRLHHSELLNRTVTQSVVYSFLKNCLDSQAGISNFASAKLKLNWPMITRSLKSDLEGFRQYPIEMIFELRLNELKSWLQFEILYSSTCPQSAQVSLEANRAQSGISHQRFVATPHAQRSRARMRVEISNFSPKDIESLILESEAALGTPVQTTVKKVDELQFAKLNAENLMFCEDAARRLSSYLKSKKIVNGFTILAEHQESLHPHNATAIVAHNYSNSSQLQFTN